MVTANTRRITSKKIYLKYILCAFLVTGCSVVDNNDITKPTLIDLAVNDPNHTSLNVAGTTKGNFSVGGDGSANYSVPISVPPGTNGVKPNLSLNYNSQQANGLVGKGWNLSGLSVISRCDQTLAQDGKIHGVDFTSNDRFCMDGSRLILSDGTYGSNNSVYHKEIENWTEVIAHGKCGTGPCYFTATTKDGSKIEYGNTTDSAVKVTGKETIRIWAVNKTADRNTNYVTVKYNDDTKNGTFSVSKIDYTGNMTANTSPQRSVIFNYQDRNDATTLYRAGTKILQNKRLLSIKTFVQNNLVYKYKLSYKYSSTTGDSLLTSIQKCAGNGQCMSPTDFEWKSGGINSFETSKKWSDGFARNTGWKNNTDYPRSLVDVNGDGLADIVGFGDKHVFVAINTGTHFKTLKTWSDGFARNTGWKNNTDYPRSLVDVNGDGLADIVGFGDKHVFVAVNTGTGFKKAHTWSDDFAQSTSWKNNTDYPRSLVDVNGDGLADIVGFGDKHVYGSLNQLIQPAAISEIVNGIGGKTILEYKPLTDSSIYVKGTTAKYPQQDIVNSMYVVSKNTVSSGSSDTTFGSQSYTYTHKYSAAKMNVKGRGWLGFASATVTNKQTGVSQTTNYNQYFPFTGRVISNVTKDSSGNILGEKVSSLMSVNGINNKTHQIQTQKARQLYYSNGKNSYTLGRNYYYDKYSNVIRIADLGALDENNDNVYSCVEYKKPEKGDPLWYVFFPISKKIVTTSDACESADFTQWNKGTDLQFTTYNYDNRMNFSELSVWDDVKNKWITSTKKFDSYGNISSVTDPEGRVSGIDYDTKYNTFPERYITPKVKGESFIMHYKYEPKFGAMIQTVDVNGNIAMSIDPDTGIDGFGRVIEVKGLDPNTEELVLVTKIETKKQDNGLSVKKWNREEWGNKGGWNNSQWNWSESFIDGLERIYLSQARSNNSTPLGSHKVFDKTGKIEKISLPYFLGDSVYYTSYVYDINNRLIKTTSPNGAVTEYDFSKIDDRNIIQKFENPNNSLHSTELVQQNLFTDSRGKIKKIIVPNEGVTQYVYDSLGRQIAIVDSMGEKTTMTYSSLGQLVSFTKPEIGTSTYVYSDVGKLLKSTNALGEKVMTEYDELGRATDKLWYNANDKIDDQVSYYYDQGKNAKGRLSSIKNNHARYDYKYDVVGSVRSQKTDITGDIYVTEYNYDALGRPSTVVYPDENKTTVKNVYDSMGDLVSIQKKKGDDWDFVANFGDYNALGKIGSTKYPNGVNSDYTYDVIGRLQTSATSKNALTFLSFSYDWSKANKLLNINDVRKKIDLNKLSQSFTYDEMGRLVKAQGSFGEDLYTYDIAGNITQMNGDVFAYLSDKQHQLAAICSNNIPLNECLRSNENAESSWFYDDAGNLEKKVVKDGAEWKFDFNAKNQLISATKNNKVIETFVYDPFGRRIQKISEDKTVTTYVSSLYNIEEKPDNKKVSSLYVSGPQGVVASYQSSSKSLDDIKVRYFHHNHIGSSTLITDETGAVASRTVYNPYGEPDESASSGDQNFRQKFTGKELDSGSNLYYFGARYYDASIGRFISPDPANQTASPYLYAGNDPITNTDPTGLWFGSSIFHRLEHAGSSIVSDVENTARGLYALGKAVVKDGGPTGFIAHRLYNDISHAHSIGGFFSGIGKGTANLVIGAANFGLDLQLAPENILLGTHIPQIPTFHINKDEQFGADIALVASFAIPGVGEEEAAAEGLELGAEAEVGSSSEAVAESEGAGSCTSFVQGTQVLTKDGSKNIEEIKVGDEVWAFDEETGGNELNVVSRLFSRVAPDILTIYLDGEKIETTPEHPFYVDGKWVEAKNITVGNILRTFEGKGSRVVGIEFDKSNSQVFNFEVADKHNYYVGHESILVHNSNCSIGEAQQIHNQLADGSRGYNTTAVARLQDADGNVLDVVAGSSQLSEAQLAEARRLGYTPIGRYVRASGNFDDFAATVEINSSGPVSIGATGELDGTYHAEMTILQYASDNGYVIDIINPNRAFCNHCFEAIRNIYGWQ